MEVPETFEEAVSSGNSQKQKKIHGYEIVALLVNETWVSKRVTQKQ